MRVIILCFVLFTLCFSDPWCFIYDSIEDPLPSNIASLGYESNGVSAIGQAIATSVNRLVKLDSVRFILSSWAKLSENSNYTCEGWNQTVTLNLYNINWGNDSSISVGSLIFSKEQLYLMPWRPEDSPNCTGNRWLDSQGNCKTGLAFDVNIDFDSEEVYVPNNFIYSIGFSTQHYGNPTQCCAGPWNSLNLGLNTNSPSKGNILTTNRVFASTNGTLILTDFTGYIPEIQFIQDNCNCSEDSDSERKRNQPFNVSFE